MGAESLVRDESGLGPPDARRDQMKDHSSGLVGFEQYLASGSGGLVFVKTASDEASLAVMRHVLRRSKALSMRCLTVEPGRLDGCFRDLAARMGIRSIAPSPAEAASQLKAASAGLVTTMLGVPAKGSWDGEVLGHLSETAPTGLFVAMVSNGPDIADRIPSKTPIFRVSSSDENSIRAWWQGVLEEVSRAATFGSIAELDRWWSRTGRRELGGERGVSGLTPKARRLLRRLQLLGRSWHSSALDHLAPGRALAELVDGGLVLKESGFLVPAPGAPEPKADQDDRQLAMSALCAVCGEDPWALGRASALAFESGDEPRGERLLVRAVRLAAHPQIRRDVWQVGIGGLAKLETDSHRQVALRLGNLAVALNDCEEAGALAAEAQRGCAEPLFEPLFLLGRARIAQADLKTAQDCFARASQLTHDEAAQASLQAHQAELLYWEGQFAPADDLAAEALRTAKDMEVRLQARNVLGKVLLARSCWAEAEAHFASDENDATCEGLIEANLRARTNRAIALTAMGRAQAAQRILEDTCEAGKIAGQPRALALGFANLGFLAHSAGDLVAAMDYYERAIETCRWLGDKMLLFNPIANLIELRLDLGMVEEAEQSLSFAQRVFSSGMPAACSAHFLVLGARTKLLAGRTREAKVLVDQALIEQTGCPTGRKSPAWHLLACRIALEEGESREARRALCPATPLATKPEERAEVALLELLVARSEGQDVRARVRAIEGLVAEARSQALSMELSALIAEICLSNGDRHEASDYLSDAIRLRDRIADTLPAHVRQAYMSLPRVRTLARLEAMLLKPERPPPNPPDAPSSKGPTDPFQAFVGEHPSIGALRNTIRKVAATSSPVLVQGESGTGKELVAEALHRLSDRRNGPLLKVNCAALAEGLLLSELFGHEKGAFTGAHARRRGRFELADGGTLLLDEIGDISPRMQAALLRVLQEGTFERVGATKTLHTDVRIICATHRDLKGLVEAGAFREDLFYRLSSIVVRIPALRERRSDIRILSDHFLDQSAKVAGVVPLRLTDQARQALEHHTWPGNVRELENVLKSASVFADGPDLDVRSLGPRVTGCAQANEQVSVRTQEAPSAKSEGQEEGPSFHDEADPALTAWLHVRSKRASLNEVKRNIEKECIQRALLETGGNITHAAELLGMKRPRLSQLAKEHGLSSKGGRA